jgi:hypothetical protein
VRSIEVDPGHWTADVNRDDNVWPIGELAR